MCWIKKIKRLFLNRVLVNKDSLQGHSGKSFPLYISRVEALEGGIAQQLVAVWSERGVWNGDSLNWNEQVNRTLKDLNTLFVLFSDLSKSHTGFCSSTHHWSFIDRLNIL